MGKNICNGLIITASREAKYTKLLNEVERGWEEKKGKENITSKKIGW